MFDHTKAVMTLPEERIDTRPPVEYLTVDPAWVSEYQSWFVNRLYFCVQSINPGNNGKHFYWPPKDRTGNHRPLTPEDIRKHLAGEQTINIQSVNAANNSCKWMAIDADYAGCGPHLDWLEEEMREEGIYPARENSRRGGHLWVLFSSPVAASLCRAYIANLAQCRNIPIKNKFQDGEGIELFPGQSVVPEGKFSNGLRGPLGVHRATNLRYWFKNAEPTLKAQMDYLRTLPRATPEQLEALAGHLPTPEDIEEQEKPKSVFQYRHDLADPLYRRTDIFDIAQYVDLSKSKSPKDANDYKVQCPACAERGGDTSCDNLSVKKSDTRLIYCFADCSYYDIRDAAKRSKGEPTWPRHR